MKDLTLIFLGLFLANFSCKKENRSLVVTNTPNLEKPAGNTVTRNVSYYIVAHASKFVPAGSVRLESNNSGNLQTVAFKRPDGKKVLIAENDGSEQISFNIKYGTKWASINLAGGSVGTFVW